MTSNNSGTGTLLSAPTERKKSGGLVPLAPGKRRLCRMVEIALS